MLVGSETCLWIGLDPKITPVEDTKVKNPEIKTSKTMVSRDILLNWKNSLGEGFKNKNIDKNATKGLTPLPPLKY